MLRSLLFACVPLIGVAFPAEAVPMQALWRGTVTSSNNATGAFGYAAGKSLDGLAATMTFVYDLDRPGVIRNTGNFIGFTGFSDWAGGPDDEMTQYPEEEYWSYSPVSPIVSASMAIGGVSESLDFSFGYVGASDGPEGAILNTAINYQTDGFLQAYYEEGTCEGHCPSIVTDLDWSGVLDLPSRAFGRFEFGGDRDVTGSVVLSSVEIAPIPLPATAWMLMAGVGALVVRKRARRRI